MSLVIQSSEAIINFSERVSHARRRGSNISRDWSLARSARTSSRALCVLSRRGVDFLASRDVAIVSRAEVISTEETAFPLGIVSERRCAAPPGEGAEGKEFVDMDGDSVVCVPFSCTGGRLCLRKVDGMTFSGGVGGGSEEGEGTGRETGSSSGWAV